MRLALALTLVLIATACRDSAAPTADSNAFVNEVIVETEGGDEVVANETTPPIAEVPGSPNPAPIPAKFHGTWAQDKTACTNLNHPSRVTISGRTVRFPDSVISGDNVTASGNQFALKGKLEGSDRPAEVQYFLDATGNELTDGAGGGAVRVRCA